MKRIASIFLLALLLFNVLGFYGLFVGIQFQNRQQLLQRFDAEDYASLEKVTIKVPLAIPYANDSRDYERVDGEFEHNGEIYRMVKQRHFQDTLFIVCVKDLQGKRIQRALTDYVKTFTDSSGNGHTPHAKTLPTLIKEYLIASCTVNMVTPGWAADVRRESAPVVFTDSFFASIIHPPEKG